jgi:hypothetical protein
MLTAKSASVVISGSLALLERMISEPSAKREKAPPSDGANFNSFALSGAEGNRTPDLLDANETRYQLRYSPFEEARRA